MLDPIVPTEDPSLLGGAKGAEEAAAAEAAATAAAAKTAEETAAVEAENKRLLETEDTNLTPEDKEKKGVLVKTQEDKRLMDTPDDKLSAEDKVKKVALIKAKDDAAKVDKGKGAPEKYADFKVPDGLKIDVPVLEEFKTAAKELNLTQEGAQKLVDLQLKHMKSVTDGLNTEFIKIKTEWKNDTIKELGTDYQKELVFAGKALDAFGTPELRKILDTTGVGSHKELVKFFIQVGKSVSEDTFVRGSNRSGGKSDADIFYGDSMKDK